MKGFIWYN